MEQQKIEYPCKWEYRIIGDNEQAIREAVFEIVDREYQLSVANHSANKRFISMHLITEVKTEEERNLIFQDLLKKPNIKMVI